jgi:Tfp pilus assembly protein PilV
MRTLRGQSLIELLVAMVVIIIGLTAASGIVFSNIRVQEISTDRLIASNFSREGIEYVKQIRDSNWLAGAAFNTGMNSGTDYTAIPVWTNGAFTGLDFSPTVITDDTFTLIKLSSHASTTNALYVQGPSYPGNATMFRRLLLIQPICSDTTVMTEGSACTSGLTVVGVRITSTVTWTKRGMTRTSQVIDELYDWK